MRRFCGMMPASEVKKRKTFIDPIDLKITIEAGPKGWTIMYADGSTEFKDVEDTTENNFDAAYAHALTHFRTLTPLESSITEEEVCEEECCEECCEE